ncbi:MAG TPA: hypothetical protein VMX17_01275 [Candidatus Glassbacteria bacterium]|nr:hypothetical protein [Candidatus Glassbacteria bacterium]
MPIDTVDEKHISGDCNECLDYQKKYAKGRDKWRKTLKEKKNVDEG